MPATTLATCEVYGTIYDVFGQPVQGAVVGVMSVYKNGALVLARTQEVSTDVDGYFTMDLPRDSVAVLYANTPGLNISCLGTPTAIPDADFAELTSIIGDFNLWDQVPVVVPGAGASIGMPVGGGTPQSVLFVDAAGKLGQDPTDFRYDAAANRLHLRAASIEDMGGKLSVTATDGGPAAVFTCFAPTPTETIFLLKQAPEATRNTVNGTLFSQLTLISDPVQGPGKLPPQDGFGQRLEFQADTDATAHRVCLIDMFWTTVAEATRTSALVISLCNNGSTASEYLRITPAGVVLPAPPTLPMHATTRQYVDAAIAAIPPSGAHPAGTGTEIQYRSSATTLGAVPSVVTGSAVRLLGDLEVDGNYAMASSASGTYFTVPDLANAVPPVSIFYAINNAANSRYVYFGRGDDGFGPRKVPRFMSFYTGPTGDESLRRMYLSPAGSFVINIQALGDQVAALTVNAAGNTTFAKAFQCNGVGEMSADPTTPLGIATRQYVDSHGVSLAADYAWTGNHSWTKPLTVGYTAYDGLALKYPNGQRTPVVAMDPNSIPLIGPIYDSAGAQGGTRVQYLCGSGAWSGTSYGAVNVNDGGSPWTWDFQAHLNVRGSFTVDGTSPLGSSGLTVNYPRPIRLQYPSGNITPIAYIDPNSFVNIGPQLDAGGGTAGAQMYILAGTGGWSSFSYGAVFVNGNNPGLWDFNSNVQIRGAFEAGNAAVAGSGFCVGTLGRVGFGYPAGGSTERLTISTAGGVPNAIFISDLASLVCLMSLTGGAFTISTNSVFQLQGSHIEIYDGAAYKQIKFGAAGSGPGGVGRALYVD